ncbi:MAG: pyruvate kinase [Eubacterium sp.]|nr:pyruvate kinase [Eubacterium sp.]
MTKTKIICTLGPATDQPGILDALVQEGMSVARFNFSHGNYEEHEKRLNALKEARTKYQKPIAALLDTKGPEIRVKSFKAGKVELKPDQLFRLCFGDVEGNEDQVSITCKELFKDVSVGKRILLDDGLIEMQVEAIEGKDIVCRVINGGIVSNNKGVNVPDVHLSLPYVSEKDRNDILFGIQKDFDFVAASFVRRADDVRQIRKILNDNGGKSIEIISKIENREGVDNIDEIIEASDGIMIARGDMGVEIASEEVPVIQKMIIKKVYEAGKKVITATQMLDSMMKNPRPTRAETTDVANAIYDGTSAIMLSGETAAGRYPVEALQTMVRIATRTEQDIDYRKRFFGYDHKASTNVTDAICHATCTTAHDLNASAILTVTKSGASARMISRYRPGCQIIGCTMDEKVGRQLNLSWGVRPLLIMEESDVIELFNHSVNNARDYGFLKPGELVVITSGVPLGMAGTTNMIKVQTVQEPRKIATW